MILPIKGIECLKVIIAKTNSKLGITQTVQNNFFYNIK
jgi:hypothetical protein